MLDRSRAWLPALIIVAINMVSQASWARSLDRAEIDQWARQFLARYQNAKTVGELLPTLKIYSRRDLLVFERMGISKLKPAPVEWRASENTFVVDGIRVDLTNMSSLHFKVAGRYLKLRSGMPLTDQFDAFLKAQPSAFDPILKWFLPELHAEELWDNIKSDSPFASRTPSFLTSSQQDEVSYISTAAAAGGAVAKKVTSRLGAKTAASGVAVGSRALGVIGFAFPIIDEAANLVEARLIAPSCEQQVKELTQVLEKNNIGLKALNCWPVGSVLEKNCFEKNGEGCSEKLAERLSNPPPTLEFWTAGSSEPRSLYVDWNESMAWERRPQRKDYVYEFDNEKLTQVNLVHTDRNDSRLINVEQKYGVRQEFKPGDSRFEKVKSEIEPFRQVFYQMGTYKSCYACEKAIQKALVRETPPAYLKQGPRTEPSSPVMADSQPSKGSK